MNPVIVVGSETLFFGSAEHAARYLEPADVRNGEYKMAIDSHGCELLMKIESSGPWLPRERVLLHRVSNTAPQSKALREALVALLRAHGELGASVEEESIDSLLARASKHKTE